MNPVKNKSIHFLGSFVLLFIFSTILLHIFDFQLRAQNMQQKFKKDTIQAKFLDGCVPTKVQFSVPVKYCGESNIKRLLTYKLDSEAHPSDFLNNSCKTQASLIFVKEGKYKVEYKEFLANNPKKVLYQSHIYITIPNKNLPCNKTQKELSQLEKEFNEKVYNLSFERAKEFLFIISAFIFAIVKMIITPILYYILLILN